MAHDSTYNKANSRSRKRSPVIMPTVLVALGREERDNGPTEPVEGVIAGSGVVDELMVRRERPKWGC